MVLAVTYGLGCAAFLFLIALTLLNRRPSGIGIFAVALFAVTALWAFASAIQAYWMPGVAHALGSAHNWMWLQFLATILIAADRKESRLITVYRWLIPAIGLAAFGNDLRFLFASASPVDFNASQVFARIVLAITGLLLVENLFRNTLPSRRWNIFPLCLAAGAMFAYDLFLYSEGFLTHSVNIALLAARGILLVLIVVPLVVTLVRNEDWRIDVHVSRRVVFHAATLTAGGIFLVAAAGAASLFGWISGEWGPVLEAGFFCGSVLVLAAVISTETLRSRTWRMIGENFFSRRYDYREEWLRFVETLSAVDDLDPLQVRVVRAIANIVDSPGGVLWLKDRGLYRGANSFNMAFDGTAVEPAESPFVAAFKDGATVQDLGAQFDRSARPPWIRNGPPLWLAVPLVQGGEIFGFIVLAPPRLKLTLNWESYDLLRTVGRQAASYLAEEQATKSLADAQAVIDYTTKFSFIVHDVKNLSSQLGMMVSNVRRYSDHPEFRTDMIKTLENSVGRLNGLLSRLRSDGEEKPREALEIAPIIASVTAEFARGPIAVEADLQDQAERVKMDAHEFRSVLTHLVANGVEASQPGGTVKLRVRNGNSRILIDVEDEGSGMSADFIRNELFRPRRSAKANGHGMGAFQVRELVRAAGGELEVTSAVGRGTLMRIALPGAAAKPAALPAQTLEQA